MLRLLRLGCELPLPPGPICSDDHGRAAASAEVQRLGALAGLGVGDELAVGDRLGEDRLLQEAVEQQPAPARAAAVEAEGELIQICVEVFRAGAALVGAKQPALEQARDPVHAGHHHMRGITLGAHRRALVLIAVVGQLHTDGWPGAPSPP